MTDLTFGRDVLGNPDRSSRLEWLVTNGIGGFASGTLSGALTRRYHGLLFAALKPPLGRTLLLAKLCETLELDGRIVELDTNHWTSGATSPTGYLHLESFRLEETIPVWVWAIGDVRLERRIWMEQGENTTYVQYHLISAPRPLRLTLKTMVNHRDAHATTTSGNGQAQVEPVTGGLRVEMFEGATPLWLLAVNAEFRPKHEWYRRYALAIETERGLDDREDLLYAGEIATVLKPGETFTVIASTRRDAGTGESAPIARIAALARRRAHEKGLLEAWRQAQPVAARLAPDWVRRLVLAADAFVVERANMFDPHGRTVIAGYPWFSDWGRDTMISLPGLTLATGRPEVARAILSTFARHVDQGMLPNYFPDQGEQPEYNTVDAALWLFQAVRAYHEATGDDAFLLDTVPVLDSIIEAYERGTRWGIVVDPEDGLVRQGAPGVQLTWMDARVGDWVVTPREGKPVEVNALWYGALLTMAGFARTLKRDPEGYEARAQRASAGFARFWNAGLGCLYDVIDGPHGDDAKIRPNQIFAVSLPDSPLPPAQRRAVVDTCGRLLLTSHGLRSLSPEDRDYYPIYFGDRRARDGAYHQGTVWTWLLPHYAIAHERVYGDRAIALGFLEPMGRLMAAMGIGTLPEIADGNPPHAPRGCFAQAWSVAEVLRAYHALTSEPRRTRRRNVPRTAMAVALAR